MANNNIFYLSIRWPCDALFSTCTFKLVGGAAHAHMLSTRYYTTVLNLIQLLIFLRSHCSFKMFFEKHGTLLLSIFFAALTVVGQVGQNVSLPLWTGYTDFLRSMDCAKGTASAEDNHTRNGTWSRIVPDPSGPVMDPYFVVSAASFSFVVIFGIVTLVTVLVQTILNKTHFLDKRYDFITLERDIKFPQWQLMLVGVFDALNGILVVFASPPTRTAPFLQAILGNFLIPLTITFR